MFFRNLKGLKLNPYVNTELRCTFRNRLSYVARPVLALKSTKIRGITLQMRILLCLTIDTTQDHDDNVVN